MDGIKMGSERVVFIGFTFVGHSWVIRGQEMIGQFVEESWDWNKAHCMGTGGQFGIQFVLRRWWQDVNGWAGAGAGWVGRYGRWRRGDDLSAGRSVSSICFRVTSRYISRLCSSGTLWAGSSCSRAVHSFVRGMVWMDDEMVGRCSGLSLINWIRCVQLMGLSLIDSIARLDVSDFHLISSVSDLWISSVSVLLNRRMGRGG